MSIDKVMSSPAAAPSSYADFSGLEALKGSARANDPAALREAARQFESLFTRMLLKSMREASLGEGLGDSDETKFYQDMYDQQLAVTLSKGDGIGLAQRLMEQLIRTGGGSAPAAGSQPSAGNRPVAVDELAPAASNEQQQRFIDALRPAAAQAAATLGVAPESIIAHAALETGWGRALPTDARGSSFNYFGVKATGQADAVHALTTEFSGGRTAQVTQDFQRYGSMADSMAGYTRLIGGTARYAAARGTGDDVHAFAAALQRGGYATDPAYVQKLVATAATVRQQISVNRPMNTHG
jgi:flagellar protein FlgJ